jgi:hypothetical protein
LTRESRRLIIASKDVDFQQRALLRGSPPANLPASDRFKLSIALVRRLAARTAASISQVTHAMLCCMFQIPTEPPEAGAHSMNLYSSNSTKSNGGTTRKTPLRRCCWIVFL